MKAAKWLLLALLAATLPAQATDTVTGILVKHYNTQSGEYTEFVLPSFMMATLAGVPSAWSLQTIDCSINICTNIPGAGITGSVASAVVASGFSVVPTQCTNQFAVGSAANGNANCITFPVGAPNTRALSLATAYQATTTTKGASVNINLTSTAAISLTGGTTNAATVYMGATNAVATGTGTPVCRYANSNTGALTIGLNLNTISGVPCHFDLPAGWFFGIVLGSGAVTITDAYEQAIG